MNGLSRVLSILTLVFVANAVLSTEPQDKVKVVYPGLNWLERSTSEVGMSAETLDALSKHVGGRGCVIRNGYLVYQWGEVSKSGDIASAVKPVISTLLLLAVQEKLLKSPDDKVVEVEPDLKRLNGGKDAAITWRHLASQTSGYGLAEKPGDAYSYNDFALALYYDVLTKKIYKDKGTAIFKTRIGDELQFQDTCEFRGRVNGRLYISVRDFARFGLLYLRNGQWNEKQIVKKELIQMAIDSPLSVDIPRTDGQNAEMLPGQESLGGGKNITPIGPGFYSFNWWLNRTDKNGQRLFPDAPADTYVASGHGGKRMLWVFPSLDLVVSWNDSKIDDHDKSPGNRNSQCNRAARLIRDSVIKNP